MTTNPRESSFMVAANQAIEDLQEANKDLHKELDAAKEAGRKRTFWTVVNSAVALVLLIVTIFGVGLWLQQKDNINRFRQQAVVSCNASNERARDLVKSFDIFFTVAEGPHPTVKVKQLVTDLETKITAANKPRNCAQAFSTHGK